MNGIIENFLIVGAQTTILTIVAIIFRRILKKSSKVFVYGMWLLILLRLCIPITTDSRFGLIDRQKAEPIVESADVGVNEDDYWQDRYEGVNWDNLTEGTTKKEPVSLNEQLAALEQSGQEAPIKDAKPVIKLTKEDVVIAGWIFGMVVMLTVSVVQLVRLVEKTTFAINTEDNVWETDNIGTAFVMGLTRARIYLPTGLSIKEREYILTHEQTHIKHKDHIVRILMLLVNIVYWWNPFVWLAIWLMKKDMEMLCDEAVVRGLEHKEVKEYLNVLLSNSARNSGIIPVMSFGENNTEMRIRHIINLKKSGAYALAVIICFGLISLVGCTTIAKHQPVQENPTTENLTTENSTTEAMTEERTTQSETESSTESVEIVPKEGVYLPEDSNSTIFITIDGLGVEIWDTSKFDRGQVPEHYAGRTDYAYYIQEWDNNAFEILGITAISDSIIEYGGVEYIFERGALYEKGGDYTINHTGYPQYDEIIDEIVDIRISGNLSFGEPAINDFSSIWYHMTSFIHGGFYLIDLDNNGTPEMFLGENGEGAWQGTIYEVYTIKDGKAVKLLNGGERFKSHLCNDNIIYFDSSSGAANGEMGFYKIKNGELVLDVGLVFDGNEHTGDPNNPWNLCEDELSKDNSVSITEEEAWGIINSYTTIPIEFTHFCSP